MKTIPVIITTDADGDHISPAEPFPENRIGVVCDGQNYVIYEPGDIFPPPQDT
jgi:hypothetical protein